MKIAPSLFLSIFLCGCGGDDAPVPTCSEAMGNFYAQGCTFFSEGNPMTQADAIMGCNQITVEANAMGGSCPGKLDTFLRCLGGVSGSAECETCNDELGVLQACN